MESSISYGGWQIPLLFPSLCSQPLFSFGVFAALILSILPCLLFASHVTSCSLSYLWSVSHAFIFFGGGVKGGATTLPCWGTFTVQVISENLSSSRRAQPPPVPTVVFPLCTPSFTFTVFTSISHCSAVCYQNNHPSVTLHLLSLCEPLQQCENMSVVQITHCKLMHPSWNQLCCLKQILFLTPGYQSCTPFDTVYWC